MGDRGRAQSRSRGRSKGKVATPSMSSLAAAAQSSISGTTPASAPQHQPIQEKLPPPQTMLHGRATIRPPGAPSGAGSGSSRRMDAGDQLTSQVKAMDIKDESAQMGRGAMRGRREIAPALRTRPATLQTKKGSFGDTVKLQANYFKLITQTDWCLYQYRVDFEPDEERTGIRKKLLSIHREKFGGYIFDGSMLWTTYLLRPDPMEMWSERESDQEKIKITVKKTVDLSVGDPAYIQLFNVITRKCLEFLDLQLVGRDYFSPKAKIVINEHKMELWPGYSTNIRQHEDSILLNAMITHKVMRKETVLHILQESYNRDRHNYENIFTNAVVGCIVMTDYNQKTYRIDDVDFRGSPNDTFDMKDGSKVSYISYYQKRYGIKIHEHNQPLLISRSKARDIRAGRSETIVLIPELCRATGITDEMRANVQLMRALADRTRIPPSGRIQKLRDFLTRLHENPKVKDEFTMWNMTLDKNLIEFNGRILPPELICFDGNKAQNDRRADWTTTLRGQRMLLAAKLSNWVIISPSKLKRDAGNFANTLGKASSSLQFLIPQPKLEEIPDDRAGSYVEALDRVVSKYNPQLVMCVVPNNRAERYSAIKKKACVDRSVPTQVVLAKNISPQAKGIMSIATKIGIQINCKLGGAPWSVEIPLNNVMVVGFDATHDTANKTRSFGATVCSLNKLYTQYYSAVNAHNTGEELSNSIALHIVGGCLKFRQLNKDFPKKIIIYRDGVGEGQLRWVFEVELQEIRAKLKELYGNGEPELALIVVSKRINTRLFYRGDNPPPGTIADDAITSPDRYDFFLVSQSVRQGTVSPTSYNVIYDTTGLPPDRMQRFTYKLTHLYFNWSGTVRVPAPCQYAHKLAMLAGQAIHRPPSTNLSDRLYFL